MIRTNRLKAELQTIFKRFSEIRTNRLKAELQTSFGGEMLMNDYRDPAQWGDLLAQFSDRNRFRRARFETFGRGLVREEEQEAHLENITVALTGADAPRVTVTRIDNSTASPSKVVTTIPRVRRLSPQFDVDNSEDGLEIEEEDGVLNLLRLESKIDGAS